MAKPLKFSMSPFPGTAQAGIGNAVRFFNDGEKSPTDGEAWKPRLVQHLEYIEGVRKELETSGRKDLVGKLQELADKLRQQADLVRTGVDLLFRDTLWTAQEMAQVKEIRGGLPHSHWLTKKLGERLRIDEIERGLTAGGSPISTGWGNLFQAHQNVNQRDLMEACLHRVRDTLLHLWPASIAETTEEAARLLEDSWDEARGAKAKKLCTTLTKAMTHYVSLAGATSNAEYMQAKNLHNNLEAYLEAQKGTPIMKDRTTQAGLGDAPMPQLAAARTMVGHDFIPPVAREPDAPKSEPSESAQTESPITETPSPARWIATDADLSRGTRELFETAVSELIDRARPWKPADESRAKSMLGTTFLTGEARSALQQRYDEETRGPAANTEPPNGNGSETARMMALVQKPPFMSGETLLAIIAVSAFVGFLAVMVWHVAPTSAPPRAQTPPAAQAAAPRRPATPSLHVAAAPRPSAPATPPPARMASAPTPSAAGRVWRAVQPSDFGNHPVNHVPEGSEPQGALLYDHFRCLTRSPTYADGFTDYTGCEYAP